VIAFGLLFVLVVAVVWLGPENTFWQAVFLAALAVAIGLWISTALNTLRRK
jgi:hypothetical protein